MESHRVSTPDLAEIGQLSAEVAAAAGQEGGIGVPSSQVKAYLRNLLLLMKLTQANIEPTVSWDNHEGRSRPVTDLASIIQDELPAPVSDEILEHIMRSLTQAGIETIGQLVSRGRWDIEHGTINLRSFFFKILEAALALRNLQFHTTGRG